MKVNVKEQLEQSTHDVLVTLEETLTKLISEDNLENTQVTEDGVRIGDAFYWCDHDCLGVYYQGSWVTANQGEQEPNLDDHECTILDVLAAHTEYQGAELKMILRELPEAVQQAVQAYWDNKRDNSGFVRFDTLEAFAQVFNPLADELYCQRRMSFNSPAFKQIQPICVDLFEYGDCKWPGKVYESGVSEVR